ncbi:hypothetical protein BDF14DRAFT_1466307 [Spinellus fusiger]|nr:hypothetical protein BDF14DRAFT_1466307 [Spinellus fusiger]
MTCLVIELHLSPHLPMFLLFAFLVYSSLPCHLRPFTMPLAWYCAGAFIPALTSIGTFFIEFSARSIVHWSALLKASLSSSLPDSEESAFEEQFKYFIVTSSLLNDMPMTHANEIFTTNPTHLTTLEKQTKIYGAWKIIVATSAVISLVWITAVAYFTRLKSYYSFSWLIVWVTMHVIGYFLFHRSHRRATIRTLHLNALDNLRQIISLFQSSDTLLLRLFESIRQVDLISQGYTLSSGFSPSHPRSSNTHASRQMIELRRETGILLYSMLGLLESYNTLLKPLVHTSNLTHLRGMYNVEEYPVQALKPNDLAQTSMTLDQLDTISCSIRYKRRESLVHLLALDVMTSGHDSERMDYEQRWDSVINIMLELVEHYTQLNNKMSTTLEADIFNDGLHFESDIGEMQSDPRAQALLHRFNMLENYVRNVQSKLFLCRHDTKTFFGGKSAAYSFERIVERFGSIDQDLMHMIKQWDESKDALMGLTQQDTSSSAGAAGATFTSTSTSTSTSAISLPSPPSSPRQSEDKQLNSEEKRLSSEKRFSYVHTKQKTNPTARHSLMSAATVASYLESKRQSLRQGRHQSTFDLLSNDSAKESFPYINGGRRPSTPVSTFSMEDE